MQKAMAKKDNKQIYHVTLLGVAVNIFLGIVKVIVGFGVNSISLITDGVHSLSDLASDVAVLVGLGISSKGPDRKHQYGHGRAETISGFIVAAMLVGVGAYMVYYSAVKFSCSQVLARSGTVFWIAVGSIVFKEFLYRITRKVAVSQNSIMLYANAWHHRTDALSSLAVLIGAVTSMGGFIYGDQIAAIVVGVMIVATGLGIASKCLREIFEEGVDKKTIEQISKIIDSTEGIVRWHKLRTRVVGREIFLDLHIHVNRDLNVVQAHDISHKLEESLHSNMERPVNVVVHVEPDINAVRG